VFTDVAERNDNVVFQHNGPGYGGYDTGWGENVAGPGRS
jgi:hypothetical protein